MGLLDKVKDAAGKAAEQAKHAGAVGKEKLEDAKLSRQIDSLCKEIGEIVVQQRRGTAPADADARIDAKVAEIGDLERKIEENDVERPAAGGSSSGEASASE